MKNSNYFFFSLLFVLSFNQLCGQIWPKVYLPNYGTSPFSVIRYYDNGFLIGGRYLTSDGLPINGLLIKTGINGEMLWYKMFGESNDGSGIFDLNQTLDGGVIIAGTTHQTDSWGDPFIMKLNACGENEWCRIYTVGQNRFDLARSVRQIPGGYIAYVYYGYDLSSNEKVHLYRLDNDGDLIWQQLYGQTDSSMWGAEGYDMMVTDDDRYLITGFCYYPDSGTVFPKILRPLLIKVDSSGNVDWELPWSETDGQSFHGESFRSILDHQKNIYTCGRHIESSAPVPGDRPTVLKTDSIGNEIFYHDLVPDSWQAVIFTINWFADSTIALGGGWTYSNGEDHQGVFKVDTLGNILDSAELYWTIYSFSDAVVTNDNKLFLVSGQHTGNQWRTYAWKLNSDLELDSLYTHPYVYDSLCPYQIPSDTIPLDCIIVGLDEPFLNPETGQIRIYPNPASDKIHIVLPDQLKTAEQNQAFQVTTVFHQWKSARLEICDLFGRIVYSGEVYQSQKEVEIDVSGWPQGMYVVRVVYQNKTVGSENFIIW